MTTRAVWPAQASEIFRTAGRSRVHQHGELTNPGPGGIYCSRTTRGAPPCPHAPEVITAASSAYARRHYP
jgi:hypothetical protein